MVAVNYAKSFSLIVDAMASRSTERTSLTKQNLHTRLILFFSIDKAYVFRNFEVHHRRINFDSSAKIEAIFEEFLSGITIIQLEKEFDQLIPTPYGENH